MRSGCGLLTNLIYCNCVIWRAAPRLSGLSLFLKWGAGHLLESFPAPRAEEPFAIAALRLPSYPIHLPTDFGLDRDTPCQGRGLSFAHFVPKTPLLSRRPGDDGASRLPSPRWPIHLLLMAELWALPPVAPCPSQLGVVQRWGTAGSRVGGEAAQQSLSPQLCTQLSPNASGLGGLS